MKPGLGVSSPPRFQYVLLGSTRHDVPAEELEPELWRSLRGGVDSLLPYLFGDDNGEEKLDSTEREEDDEDELYLS